MSELVPALTDLAPAAGVEPLLELQPERAASGDPYRIYLDSLDSAESRTTMRGCLDYIARMVVEAESDGPLPQDIKITGECRTWWRLRYAHTRRIRTQLASNPDWSYKTVNKHLIGLRRVLKECWRLGLMPAEDYHRAIDVPGVKGEREPAGRNINDNELNRMLDVCDNGDGPAWIRNGALVGVLWCTGIRRAEAAKARIEHYDAGERALRIVGKGNKERTVFIVEDIVPRLDRWLDSIPRRGPLFRPIDKHGNIRDRAMTAVAIGEKVAEIRQLAGLPPLSTHDFRRNYAGDLFDLGVDIAQVQQIMGHASATTTALYDRRPKRALRDSADKMRLPKRPDDARPLPQRVHDLDMEKVGRALVNALATSAAMGHEHVEDTLRDYVHRDQVPPEAQFVRDVLTRRTDDTATEWFGDPLEASAHAVYGLARHLLTPSEPPLESQRNAEPLPRDRSET